MNARSDPERFTVREVVAHLSDWDEDAVTAARARERMQPERVSGA